MVPYSQKFIFIAFHRNRLPVLDTVFMFLFLCDSLLVFKWRPILLYRFPLCVTRETAIMSGHGVSKETWDSHNKMMLEPLSINDSEVCVHWILETESVTFIWVLEAAVPLKWDQEHYEPSQKLLKGQDFYLSIVFGVFFGYFLLKVVVDFAVFLELHLHLIII